MKKTNIDLTFRYLKDLRNACNDNKPFSLSAEASKRGLDYSATLPTILLRKRMVIPTGKSIKKVKIYSVTFVPESLTKEDILNLYGECKCLIDDYALQRRTHAIQNKPDSVNDVIKKEIPIKSKSLELYTDKALFAELKRRGYTGNLRIVTDVKL